MELAAGKPRGRVVSSDASPADPPPRALSDRIKSLALALGFDRAGICSAAPSAETRFVREWVRRGHAAAMGYIERRVDEREDPSRLMPGIQSVIVVGLAHDPPAELPEATGEETSSSPIRIASYVGKEDYHDVMLEPLRALATGLEALVPGPVETRCYVDTGPVLERVFAARAGLGWQGKNTCLIDRELGSRMLLGVVLCSLDLVHDVPEADHCGTCRACLDACPTNAFEEPYVLDARKCISYNTIESREGIDPLLRGEHGDWAFGCDICQDVCPWNRRREAGDLPDPMGLRGRLAPDPRWVRAELRWVLSLDEEAWRAATRGSALRRSRYRGLMRNALVAAGNSGDSGLVALVEGFAAGEDTMLAEHARWALARL
ncbi:MAG TPA: tRNA epoxyqueuosine(34) reductase QueG [Myxococcales bacterium]|nr:tRNA epoxyqueuosine(34) reductase QueG [Myxococcales bacterium]